MRNFQADFCAPAFIDLTEEQMRRVGVALDTAILYGVLEYIEGNESLHLPKKELEQVYAAKVARLAGRNFNG